MSQYKPSDRISISIPSYHSSSPPPQFSRGGSMSQSREDVSFAYDQSHSHSHSILVDDGSETDTPTTANPASILMSSTMGDDEGYDDNMDERSLNKKKTRLRNPQSRRKRITTSASVIIDDRFLNELDSSEDSSTGHEWRPFPPNSTFEEQLILRLPKHVADQLSQNQLSTNQLEFEFRDERYGTMKINRNDEYEIFRTILVDLPCIIETHKACKERKTWYKVCDVCQMLIVCKDSDFKTIDPCMRASFYSWPHGLTPPMRNVREKRFRKTIAQVSRQSIEEVEAFVAKLIEADKNAINVEYELRDISAQSSITRPEDSFSIIEDGDLSDESDLAAEIEYGLLEEEEKQIEQPIVEHEEPVSLSTEAPKESLTDFSFLQKSLSARLKIAKGGTKHHVKKPLTKSQDQKGTKEEISSDIVMLFEDIDNTQ